MSKPQFTSNATTTQSTFSILGIKLPKFTQSSKSKVGNHKSLPFSKSHPIHDKKNSLILSIGDSNVQSLSRIIEPKQIFPIPALQSETKNATIHFSMLHELFPWKDTNKYLDPPNTAQITKQNRIPPSLPWETNELIGWISKHGWGVV